MPIETNLNQSPYFDDFDEDKKFHRVLFRPGFAVQARELTQLQTILQNQIERFAGEILVDGTVISGCAVQTSSVRFARLRDKDANNRVILLSDFYDGNKLANATIVSSSTGVEARLFSVKEGSEAGDPNFLTIYYDVTKTGSNNTSKNFGDNEQLYLKGAANNDFIVHVLTANGDSTNTTGLAVRATAKDGIIYHKGTFIKADAQSIVVNRYGLTPSAKLGYTTVETIIDSNQDSSLLDNATGATNFAAPGANRLKITPVLSSRSLTQANTTSFFTIAEIQDGVVIKKNDTQYSDLEKYISQRIFETNGNYTTSPFNIRIREHLKSGTNGGKYTAAKGGDINKLAAGIENGTGYVSGKRIEITGPAFRDVDKATDYEVKDARTIGQTIGHYVYANEVVGNWDFQGLRTVSLRDAAQNAISGLNYGATSAAGSEVGTAKVRGIQWDQGTMGTQTGRFRIYLFDIQMNSGKSFFDDVLGLYINGGGTLTSSFADVLTVSGRKLQEAGLKSLVFPFAQRGTKTLKDEDNNVDTQFVFRAESTVNFAVDGTVTITPNTAHTGGTESFDDAGTLTVADRRNNIIIAKTAAETDPLTGQITDYTATSITGSGTAFQTNYKVGDVIRIEDSTPRDRIITQINSDISMTTESGVGTGTGVTLAHRIIYPKGYIFDLSANGSMTAGSGQLQIDLNTANLASTFTASVTYDLLRSDSIQTAKTVFKNKFVHINTSTHSAGADGPWALGVSDAFKLVAVYKGTTTGVSDSDNDVTSHFTLDDGQKEDMYDTSYLVQKPTSTLDLSSCGLLVKFHYFGRDRSSGIGFLSVDSYPIDDVNTSSTSAITTQEIPIFTSPRTGKQIDLRDAVDFRPIKKNSRTPSANAVAVQTPSITNPDANTEFFIDADGSYVPTPDKNFQADIQFYLPRKDRVIITSSGDIKVVKGLPKINPKTPEEPSDSMTIAVLDIPPYPSLPADTAKEYNRRDYQVRLSLENNRRYTMKDLRAVDQRVKTLEYYSSLNALESSAKGKQIFDDATGLDRFKNGFLVDNFDSHNLADTTKVGYRAAININNSTLRPSFIKRNISTSKDITFSSTNLRKTGNIITLDYTDLEFIKQPKASKLRNPVQELQFNWQGKIILDPPMDNFNDITTSPDIQVDFDGMYEAIDILTQQISDVSITWGDWETISSSRFSETTTDRTFNTITTTEFGFQEEQIRSGLQLSVSPQQETISLGNQIENVAIREFMRSIPVKFTGYGMRPNTKVFAYFDDEPVSNFCTPTNSSFANTGLEGDDLVTDSSGVVHGVFRIPSEDGLRFRSGTKRFELNDVENAITESSLQTTRAFGNFTSTGLDISQRGTSLNIVEPDFSFTEVFDDRSLRRVTRTQQEDADRDGDDPLAQTIFINLGRLSDGAFITKVDLYFGKKSSTYPISVELREVENGFPTTTILPFGQKFLQPSAVNISSDASVATTFTFDSPVFVGNDKDIALVVKPAGNNNEYAIWVSELGATDTITNEIIDQQPSTGILFSSANDRTWSAFQPEDLKYTLYRAEFTTNQATVYFENDNLDFFSIDNISGTFNADEKIRAESVLSFSNNDSVSVGQILQTYAAQQGAATSNTHYANGVIRQIVGYDSPTQVVTVKVDNFGNFPTTETSSNALNLFIGSTFYGNTTAFTANTNTGFVYFFDRANGKLDIKNSSGGFANGYIRGQKSGASARVTTINDLPLNTVVPKIPQILYSDTSASYELRSTSSSGVIDGSFTPIDLGVENNFINNPKKLYSKSNEDSLTAVDGSKKSFVIKGTLSTSDSKVSPIIDETRSNAIIIENVINNDSTDEHKEVGNAQVRYITKPVELADGQDAEDLKVFVTAFKPSGTDVKVYARIHNPEDSEDFTLKDYTPLTQITSSTTISDAANPQDFKEFEFGFSANTDGQGFLTTANSHARLNTDNDNIVAYRASDGSVHNTYKTFAIKIVLTSSGSNLVPIVRDMRAIALQV